MTNCLFKLIVASRGFACDSAVLLLIVILIYDNVYSSVLYRKSIILSPEKLLH